MAASRIGSTASMCRRYRVFFVGFALLVGFQLFLAINFYGLTDPGVDLTRESYRRRSMLLEADDILTNPLNFQRAGGNSNSSNAQQERIKALYHNVLNKLRDLQDQMNTTEPPCDVTGKEVSSALSRAPSERCKQEITRTYCDLHDGKLYPKELPRFCPLKEHNTGEYVGCYRDSRNKRILDGNRAEFKRSNSPTQCVNHCLRLGFNYAGVEFSFECFCGEMSSKAQRLSDSVCDTMCPGDNDAKCGGYHAVNVYRTGFGLRADNPSKYIPPKSIPVKARKIKIVFVLTVNGRALRQIQRLLKTLYDPQHYYYIHVDKRQEYLHRELTKVTANISNVEIAADRYSTIWGGASLLTMHLACMEALLKKTEWHWDYFINLSESDYPIKTVRQLEAYLTKYKSKNFLKNHGTQTSETIAELIAYLTNNPEKNFLKSHGKDTHRFIRKQGLNMLFYECDTHMWRLGERPLLDGVRFDGGSDWFCLHRSFAQYVSSSEDELITGLKQFWKYSLLPAESFFHTALQNSLFCGSWVNNNLHLTNWKRKQGCKCQYKHIVDWCGCSPNDFVPADFTKIKGAVNKPIYFARKFEAIINQAIINEIDVYLFGGYSRNTPGLANFWQNEYHHMDVNTPTADHQVTAYGAFTRLAAARLSLTCNLTPSDLLEVTFFNQADLFMGLLVKFKVKSGSDDSTVETLIQVQRPYRVVKVVGPVKRLKFMEVGSHFDPKEEVFRNFGSILGPQSELKLKLSWGPGDEATLTLIYMDPAGVIAGFFEVPVAESASDAITTHMPSFLLPLRPGVWIVRALYLWNMVAESEFLVLPLTYLNGRAISTDPQGVNSGPVNGSYASKSFNQLRSTLGMDPLALNELKVRADANALRSGKELREWVDSLVLDKWRVSESCLVSGQDGCLDLTPCGSVKWSSLSPDPKSEIRAEDLISGRGR